MRKFFISGTITYFLLTTGLFAQNYPSYNTNPLPPDSTGMTHNAVELAKRMRMGWNLGNTFEAIKWVPADNGKYRPTSAIELPGESFETAWGNPEATHLVSNGVYKDGFNVFRIPCAWDIYVVDTASAKIQDFWLARVKRMVDSCLKYDDMYVLLNIHYDGGWLEVNCNPDKKEYVNKKQKAYWEQIATYFRDYDERLLFAACNEPNVHNETQMEVLASYEQTFVDVVRATGGRNYYRTLIIQGPSTDIDESFKLMRIKDGNEIPANIKTKDRIEIMRKNLGLSAAQVEQLWAIEKTYNPEFDTEERHVVFDEIRAREQTRQVKIREILTDSQRKKYDAMGRVTPAMPKDVVPGRMMMELHYYTPYNFTGLTEDADWGKVYYYWGKDNLNPDDPEHCPSYGDELFAIQHFDMAKRQFVDNGIPIIMGEYGCNRKDGLFTNSMIDSLHHKSRMDWLYFITKNALEYGFIPVYWDNGGIGVPSMGLYNRLNGKAYDREAVDVIMKAGKDADRYWK